jgi:pimeloyl-ACP methyl ester carboxylesterase
MSYSTDLHEGFTKIGHSSFISVPLSGLQKLSPTDPDTILFASWMDATPKHISKYISQYKHLYPSARILLVTQSTSEAIFRWRSQHAKQMIPMANILATLPPSDKLLWHTFSNGGAINSAAIARAYKAQTGKPVPMNALVLDSAPGKAHYIRSLKAITAGMPKNPVVRFLGIVLLNVFMISYKIMIIVLRKKNLLDVMIAALVDKELFPVEAPRLYIYSDNDEMVSDEDVEWHAKLAKEAGYVTYLEKFVGSKHVAHMLQDKERYWRVIQELWERK